VYKLRGMICYYGKHYTAYFYIPSLQRWYVFDDITVRPVGVEWADIQERCLKGRLQPSVLFYESVNPISQSEQDQLNSQMQTDENMFAQYTQQPTVKITPNSSTVEKMDSPKREPEKPDEPDKPAVVQVSPNHSSIKISKIVHDDIETEISKSIQESQQKPEPIKIVIPVQNDLTLEDSFIMIHDTKALESEEIDFIVTRTNWLYRRQMRRYRFKQDNFLRILPGSAVVKEEFEYKDVFDITMTTETSMIIRFYSGKEAQYIASDKTSDMIDIIRRRAKQLGHSFPIKNN